MNHNTLDAKSPARVATTGLLVDGNCIKTDSRAGATVFLLNCSTEDTGFTGFHPEIPVNDARVYPAFDIRCQFAGKEFSDALGVESVFLAVPGRCCGLQGHGASLLIVSLGSRGE